jgi:hypothetical protein
MSVRLVATQDTDAQARIDAIERETERLGEVIESCSKGMQIAKALMTIGALCLLTGLIGLLQLNAAASVMSFGAIIGGIVWYGSSHSTRLEARERLVKINAERSKAIDTLDFRSITTH